MKLPPGVAWRQIAVAYKDVLAIVTEFRAYGELERVDVLEAARLVLDRIMPARKGHTVRVNLPVVETASDVLSALGATVCAMAKGELTPEEAAIVSGVLETQRKAIETVEIEQRLAAVDSSVER